MFAICALVTQLPYCLGMLPPSVPQSGDEFGSTSDELVAPEPGEIKPSDTMPL